MKIDIKDIVDLMIDDTKKKKDEYVLRLKMEYGTKWNEEFRRREIDKHQLESERHDR